MNKVFKFENRVVGTLKDGVISRGVKEEYRFRKHNAWGLDKPMIDSVPEDTEIRLKSDTGDTYKTTAKVVKEFGIPEYYTGYGKQYFLPLHYWEHD